MSKPTPVAWIVNKALDELKKHHSASATVWSGLAKNKFINDAEPLYPSSALQALEEENARLRATLKEALKVIEPFAKSDMQEPDWREDNSCVAGTCDFTVGHLRAARRFMEESRDSAETNKQEVHDV